MRKNSTEAPLCVGMNDVSQKDFVVENNFSSVEWNRHELRGRFTGLLIGFAVIITLIVVL
jgi:hypothetical protein